MTGPSGFVGGSILSALAAVENYEIIALVRKAADAEALGKAYSNITTVIGTLSDTDLVASNIAQVDFVVHVAGDNVQGVKTMIDAITKEGPSLLCITGTRCLIDQTLPSDGTLVDKVWSDVKDAETIITLPKTRIHAEADQAIIAHSIKKNRKVMLLSPGQLWGQGLGLLKKEGASAAYYKAVQAHGQAFVVGKGEAAWAWASTRDLQRAVVFLVGKALSGDSQDLGVNREGYYLLSTDQVTMMERAEAIRDRLHLDKVESVTPETAAKYHPFGALMWGSGARFKADKLKDLGWKPLDKDWRPLMMEKGGQRG